VVLEGGSIDVNGLGTLLTTEECLQSKTQERNPGFSKRDYEEVFRNYLGATNVLWLKNGIAGDDTHGHVDDLSRFVDPATVVTIVEENKSDAITPALQENLALLQSMKDQDGKPLRVEALPMPAPVFFNNNASLPVMPTFISQTNLYSFQYSTIPTTASPWTLHKLFRDGNRAIYCRDLVLGLGTIHCMTQQLPAGK